MDLGLTDKTALVAASSKGLGKAIAQELIIEGVRVAICGRNEKDLQKTRAELESIKGSEVKAYSTDLAVESERLELVSNVLNDFGNIDILVTNTGGPPPGDFQSFDHKAWQDAFELLLGSATSLIRQVLPGMKAQQWGRIIMVSSVAVMQPVDKLILSNAVRSSLLGLMKSLANELGKHNITVNNVMPGYTRTDRLNQLIEKNPEIRKVVDDIPLGRFGKPEEFAAAVTFLASQRASYITGTSIPVDGGWIKGI